MEEDFVKKPCKHCPFRSDITPFLRTERAEELAYASTNPYSDFSCHKTLDYDNDEGEACATSITKTCAGFLTLRAQEGEKVPEGFEPSWDIVYTDVYDMITAHEEYNKD